MCFNILSVMNVCLNVKKWPQRLDLSGSLWTLSNDGLNRYLVQKPRSKGDLSVLNDLNLEKLNLVKLFFVVLVQLRRRSCSWQRNTRSWRRAANWRTSWARRGRGTLGRTAGSCPNSCRNKKAEWGVRGQQNTRRRTSCELDGNIKTVMKRLSLLVELHHLLSLVRSVFTGHPDIQMFKSIILFWERTKDSHLTVHLLAFCGTFNRISWSSWAKGVCSVVAEMVQLSSRNVSLEPRTHRQWDPLWVWRKGNFD